MGDGESNTSCSFSSEVVRPCGGAAVRAAGPVAEGSHSNRDGHLVPSAATPAGAHARFLGPSQRRYGDYFLSVLASPELRRQEGLTKVLRQVTRRAPAASVAGQLWVWGPREEGCLGSEHGLPLSFYASCLV